MSSKFAIKNTKVEWLHKSQAYRVTREVAGKLNGRSMIILRPGEILYFQKADSRNWWHRFNVTGMSSFVTLSPMGLEALEVYNA